MSILMAVPVIAFVTNILLTMRGSWNKVFTNAPLGFIVFGMLSYVLVSFQGSFQGLPSTNAFLHFSQWPVGHAHLALLGAFGFLSVGVAYWVIPRITGREIYSKRIMNFDFWLMAVGFVFFFIAMTGAGLQQSSNWYTHINVVETLPTLKIWFVFRAISGGVVVMSAFVFAYNIFMTFWASRKPHSEETYAVESVQPSALPHSAFQLRSQRSGLAMIITGACLYSQS